MASIRKLPGFGGACRLASRRLVANFTPRLKRILLDAGCRLEQQGRAGFRTEFRAEQPEIHAEQRPQDKAGSIDFTASS